MIDLHDRFRAWLADGGHADLARDAAIHASGCEACLRDAAALDALQTIDVGAASMPPARSGRPASERAAPIALVRALSGAAAVFLLASAVGIGIGALLDQPADGQVGSAPTQSPVAEGVLSGVGGAVETPTPSSTGTPTPEPSPSSETSVAPTPTPVAGQVGPPPPVVTPRPTAALTVQPATPAPTPVPTPEPTPVPTPVPTPTPTPLLPSLPLPSESLPPTP